MSARIVLSSLFTLFTLCCCIRSDFPLPNDSKIRIISTKLNIIFWVLLCPEAVLLWATRQWFEAGEVAKEFQYRGWTRRHGLFLLMGGFVLCDKDGQPSKTLSFPHFSLLVRQKFIDFPQLTSLDIQERSNLHPTFALIALMQATWFVAQCLSRLISANMTGAVVTQLEAITAILVISNWCIFFFAWKKPLDTQCPILLKNHSTLHDRGLPRGRLIQVDDAFEIEQNLSRSQITERRFQLEYPHSQSPSLSKSITALRLTRHSFVSAILWPLQAIFFDMCRFIPPDRDDAFQFPDGMLQMPLFYVPNTVFQPAFLLPAAVLGMGVSIAGLVFVLRSGSTFQSFSQKAQVAWRIAAIISTSFSALTLGVIILINVLFLSTFLFDLRYSSMKFVDQCSFVCVTILYLLYVSYRVCTVPSRPFCACRGFCYFFMIRSG